MVGQVLRILEDRAEWMPRDQVTGSSASVSELDHVHALAQYIENAGALAWWTGYARGPNGEIDHL